MCPQFESGTVQSRAPAGHWPAGACHFDARFSFVALQRKSVSNPAGRLVPAYGIQPEVGARAAGMPGLVRWRAPGTIHRAALADRAVDRHRRRGAELPKILTPSQRSCRRSIRRRRAGLPTVDSPSQGGVADGRFAVAGRVCRRSIRRRRAGSPTIVTPSQGGVADDRHAVAGRVRRRSIRRRRAGLPTIVTPSQGGFADDRHAVAGRVRGPGDPASGRCAPSDTG